MTGALLSEQDSNTSMMLTHQGTGLSSLPCLSSLPKEACFQSWDINWTYRGTEIELTGIETKQRPGQGVKWIVSVGPVIHHNRSTAMLNAVLAFKLLGKMALNIKLLHENHSDIKNCGHLILFESSIFDQKITANHQTASIVWDPTKQQRSLMHMTPLKDQ